MEQANRSKSASITLTVMVIIGTLGISGLAGWISFFTLRDLAIILNWPADTAGFLMPIVELFLVVGAAEKALRVRDGEQHSWGPTFLSWGALVVTLAGNVGDHVLRAVWHNTVTPGDEWKVWVLGVVAAIPPVAQMGTLQLLAGRLLRIARNRAANRVERTGPSLWDLARQRATDALAAKLAPPAPAPGLPAIERMRLEHERDQLAVDTERAEVAAKRAALAPGERATEPSASTMASEPTGRREPSRAHRVPKQRPERASEPAGQRADDPYRSYVDLLEREGREPNGATAAAWAGLGHDASGRRIKRDWRARYAAEVASGQRTAPDNLPTDVLALLVASAPGGERAGSPTTERASEPNSERATEQASATASEPATERAGEPNGTNARLVA